MNWQIINTKQTHVEASNCLKNYFPVPVWKIINQLLPSFLKLHNIKHGQLRFCPAVYLGPGLWWHFTCVFVSPMHNFIWKSGNLLHFLLWKTQNMYLIRQNVLKVAITPNIKYTLVCKLSHMLILHNLFHCTIFHFSFVIYWKNYFYEL